MRLASSSKVILFLRGVLLVGAALMLVACGEEAPPAPANIVTGDSCVFCKQAMAEKDQRFAAEFITRDRFVRKFCDISCMVKHANTKVKKENVIAYFVADYPSGEWVKGEEAVYVKSDRFETPMNGGILAFRDKASADALSSQYQAQVLGFAELMK
jgi:nitrous oxide reductase accessory protein NosL